MLFVIVTVRVDYNKLIIVTYLIIYNSTNLNLIKNQIY